LTDFPLNDNVRTLFLFSEEEKMKKLIIVLLIGLCLSAAAFAQEDAATPADELEGATTPAEESAGATTPAKQSTSAASSSGGGHPSGWGLGLNFNGNVGSGFGAGANIALKAPQLPIYWGIAISNYGLGVTGDLYLLEGSLKADWNLNYYLGAGGYVSLWNWNGFAFGVRGVAGLSWYFIPKWEAFLEASGQLGLHFSSTYNGIIHLSFFNFGLGVRYWF
jgi:hypothetical protein